MKPPQKTQKEGSDSAQVGGTWDLGESGVPEEDMEALGPFPMLCPMHLFHLPVPDL